MESDDPWDWSVDRVVVELCTNNRSWRPHSMAMGAPPSESLETALRDNVISGSVLLLYVTESLMKETLGLAALGHRAFIQNAITELRSNSTQYQAHIAKANSTSLLPSMGIPSLNKSVPITPDRGDAFARLLAHLQLPQPNAQPTTDAIAVFARLGAHAPLPPQQSVSHTTSSASNLDTDRSPRRDYTVDDPHGYKRRKVDSIGSNVDLGLGDAGQDVDQRYFRPAEHAAVGIHTPTPKPVLDRGFNSNGRKRKRIAPTLVTAELARDRDRSIPTQADNVIRHDPANIEPGVLFVGDDGRKRMVPLRLSGGGDSHEPYIHNNQLHMTADDNAQVFTGSDSKTTMSKDRTSASLNNHNPSVHDYLGKGKLPVDQVFYDETPIGEEIPDDTSGKEFILVGAKISSGRRLYMHGLMRHFFRTERQLLEKDGKIVTAVRPYASKLALKHCSPSFSLYYNGSDQAIHVRREELRSWPELDPEVSLQDLGKADDEKRITFHPIGPEMLHGFDLYANWDPSCLDKYKFIKGGDEVLPLYGESDEENEYDEETWLEMEAERGTLEKPLKALKRSHLSVEDVEKIIDECIGEMVLKWKEAKLPLRQHKSLNIWRKFVAVKKIRMKAIRGDIRHLDERVTKMRKEIASEIWTSQIQVRKQCRIMELSIFNREDLVWEHSVLNSNRAPEKGPRPPLAKEKRLSARSGDGGEGESVETETESLSSEDEGFENFIVADDEQSAEERELNLADGEDEEDDASSEISFVDVDGDMSEIKNTGARSKSPKACTSADTLQSTVSDDGFTDYEIEPHSVVRGLTPIKAEQDLPKLPTAVSGGSPVIYDLTMLSSSDDAPKVVNLITPIKRPALVRLTHRSSPHTTPTKRSKLNNAPLLKNDKPPGYHNPLAIAQYSNETWEAVEDRDRLVIAIVHSMDDLARGRVFSSVSALSPRKLWSEIHGALQVISGKSLMEGPDPESFENMARLARLFEIYVDCKDYPWRDSPSPNAVTKLIDARPVWFLAFHELARGLESFFEKRGREGHARPAVSRAKLPAERGPAPVDVTEEDEDEGPQSAVKRHGRLSSGSDGDVALADIPHKKRKKKIFEDVEARDLREHDRQRQAEQEARRQKLQEELAKRPTGMVNSNQIIVNETKLEEHGFIYVNDHIARRIKKHQIEGVRFMWNEVVTDQRTMQGCLLAHTMGLGKTMQVITLLVAIAEAAKSIDPLISSQIPESLRVSRTMVLCPPGLIDNWMDELLTWAPEHLLGDFRKVDSSVKISQRLHTIGDWYEDGGVLVIGYEMFRQFVNNKRSKYGDASLSAEQHEEVCKALLEGPNIIIADEAHKMKNATAAITIAASNFRSRSRIALTGSPLANNVEEYHTMIEWVAPNYLGPAVEFRAKYVEPIQQGLWVESSPYERRKSLKMLGVLKEDLAPKVHRADMAVLRDDLPPKKEFVITIPLTELQKKAYTLYVRSMLSGSKEMTKDGKIQQATIWHWLAVLSLLCNHPSCFNAKLNERKEDARKEITAIEQLFGSRVASDEEEGIAADLNAPIWKIGVSHDLITTETELFSKEASDLSSVELSFKTKILSQILDASKAAGDKVLVFSQSLPTLDFLENMCKDQGRHIARLDGSTKMSKRQSLTKDFNKGNTEVYLISTTAGGLGLNLPGANRVVIFDFKFNPIMEEQAVGRAYRIGQKKPVFVYRFVAGGTFEDGVHNKAVFKMQLASRVVDKKNPTAWAKKTLGDFLFEPRIVEQKDLSEFNGMDPKVLDVILDSQDQQSTIRAIVQSDTYERDDMERLTVEEQIEVKQLLNDEKLKRSDPKAWQLKQAQLQIQESRMTPAKPAGPILPPGQVQPKQQTAQSSGSGSVSQRAVPLSVPTVPGLQNSTSVAAQRREFKNSEQSSRASLQPVAASGPVLTSPPDSWTACAKETVRVWTSEADATPASISTTDSQSLKSMPRSGAIARVVIDKSSSTSTESSEETVGPQGEAWKRLKSALIETSKGPKASTDVPAEEHSNKIRTRIDEVCKAFQRHAPEASVLYRSLDAAAQAVEKGAMDGNEVLNDRLGPDAFAKMFIQKISFKRSSQHSVLTDNGKVRASHSVLCSSLSDFGPNPEDLRKERVNTGVGAACNGHVKRGSSEAGLPDVPNMKKFRQPSGPANHWLPHELQRFLIHYNLDTTGSREIQIARCMAKELELWHQADDNQQAPVTHPAEQDVIAGEVSEDTDIPTGQEAVKAGEIAKRPQSPMSTASDPTASRGSSVFKRAFQSLGFGS